jgi:hypothetical protein
MPGRKQRPPGTRGQRDQRIEFADAGARRLLQHHVLAACERRRGLGAPHLRRRAQRHRIDRRTVAEQFFQRGEMRHIRQPGIAAGDRGKRHAIGSGDGGNVLITRDLAQADDGDAQCGHGSSPN